MKRGSCLMMVLVVVMSVAIVRSDESFIEKMCKQTPNYDLCVSLIRSDPRGFGADAVGITLILVKNINVTAMNTMQELKSLYETRHDIAEPLLSCMAKYKTILEIDVPQAVEALRTGVPKFAEVQVTDPGIQASSCESGFDGNSPLTKLTKSMQDISDVVRAIVRIPSFA